MRIRDRSSCNRKARVPPLTAFPAALLLLVVVACTSPSQQMEKAESVGDFLVAAGASGSIGAMAGSTEIPHVVRLGAGLVDRLQQIGLRLHDCQSRVKPGDSPPGDGKASHIVTLDCSGKSLLGIRLDYDSGEDKFHILGYWTPPESTQR